MTERMIYNTEKKEDLLNLVDTLREGDIVLIEPWEFDNDRGDIVFKYNPSAVQWLRNKGYLKDIMKEF